MLKKLLPVLLVLIGLGGGIGAGLALRPEHIADDTVHAEVPETADAHDTTEDAKDDHAEASHEADGHGGAAFDYVKLNNQFVVPVVHEELVESLVVMSLSIEVEAGLSDTVYEREPKLRDGFLQVLFDHANMGGFEGEFTNSNNMDVLRGALTEVAQDILGKGVTSILITDLARQDV
ncbi:flagellar basal body-associated FliL family protein [Roseovarius sp. A21]|uniref:Flagellar basal body-associated FliL family protein n=1 Tax=Roseovarius bejariae TaxID=2576383 RepID=A0A844CL29_9RHOB|nr:flagellar basal body-associated FliL family protein [Roseovarius bejariae]MRU15457.1 flagellar basal body-associated FliL family protein [Roseovarius bejariae]